MGDDVWHAGMHPEMPEGGKVLDNPYQYTDYQSDATHGARGTMFGDPGDGLLGCGPWQDGRDPTASSSAGLSLTPSEVEDEAGGAGAGDADHHAVVGLARSCVSTESRWSGMPSRTGVSQVPQVPSPQEDSTPTRPLRRRRGSNVSGGTVRVSSLWARCDLEGLVQHGLGERLGDEPLHVQRAVGPGGAALLDRGEQRLRAAAVDRVSGMGLAERAGAGR